MQIYEIILNWPNKNRFFFKENRLLSQAAYLITKNLTIQIMENKEFLLLPKVDSNHQTIVFYLLNYWGKKIGMISVAVEILARYCTYCSAFKQV
jgi:hypothetical protein